MLHPRFRWSRVAFPRRRALNAVGLRDRAGSQPRQQTGAAVGQPRNRATACPESRALGIDRGRGTVGSHRERCPRATDCSTFPSRRTTRPPSGTPRVPWRTRRSTCDLARRSPRDCLGGQYSPLITKNEPRMVPASFDFWRANLNRGASSAGTSMPSESLNPTARFVGSSIVYSTLIDSPLS